MTLILKEFDSYTVEYFSKNGESDTRKAIIRCFTGNSQQEVGRITFLDVKPLPDNNFHSNLIYVYFHLSLFDDIIDILRNEKPLRIYLEDYIKVGGIITSYEPIGEQEP
jgi:hypothetical protein